MDWTLEVVLLPVADIDRAIPYYRDRVGLTLDHDRRNDADGNSWTVERLKVRAEKPLIPPEWRAHFND